MIDGLVSAAAPSVTAQAASAVRSQQAQPEMDVSAELGSPGHSQALVFCCGSGCNRVKTHREFSFVGSEIVEAAIKMMPASVQLNLEQCGDCLGFFVLFFNV